MPARRPLIDSVVLEAEATAILAEYIATEAIRPPPSRIFVSGYTRKSGVRVRGYYRTRRI
jgi:hypothetical protein